ncbi:MAG TPA: hypothetical protein VMB85_01060 [Bryobacteraceae bacterium]|nr:hypothetical protein [Bryobacteraceae bacterium]
MDRENEPELLVIDSAATPSPRNDDAQRQRILARHLAAVAEHLRHLSDLEKFVSHNG